MADNDMPSGSVVDPRSYIPPKWMSLVNFLVSLLAIPILVLVALNYAKLH
jgi:hypothetical protein